MLLRITKSEICALAGDEEKHFASQAAQVSCVIETQSLPNHNSLFSSSWGSEESYIENAIYKRLYLETNTYVTALN